MDSFWQAAADFTHQDPLPVEYRLYYDDQGAPLFYTCDKPMGTYIVVDTQTYAQGRYDLKIINGQIKYPSQIKYAKLVPSIKGTACYYNDVSIISSSETDAQFWKLKTYEKD